jgi:hypothetical protein
VAASVPDRAALHALEPHLGGLAERPLAERDLGVRPPRLRFREAGEGLEQPLALAGAPDVRLVRRPASARAPDREGQSLPWRARIPAVTPATATSSSDGGATVAPQSEPDFSPRQWPEADVTRVRKKERNPLVMRVPGSPRETGPAGLEPATPGFGGLSGAASPLELRLPSSARVSSGRLGQLRRAKIGAKVCGRFTGSPSKSEAALRDAHPRRFAARGSAPAVLAGGDAASCEAPQPLRELLVRQSQRGIHVAVLGRPTVLLLLPRPPERAVEHLFDSTHGDPIVLGTDQEVEPGERSIEKLGLGRLQVLELRAVELLPQLFAFEDLLSTGAATSCAILSRKYVG